MQPPARDPQAPLPDDRPPVDPADCTEPDLAYARWREQRLREFDEDYAAWRGTGARHFPPDFDAWRSARRELIAEQSAAGLPLLSAGEDAPESERAARQVERS